MRSFFLAQATNTSKAPAPITIPDIVNDKPASSLKAPEAAQSIYHHLVNYFQTPQCVDFSQNSAPQASPQLCYSPVIAPCAGPTCSVHVHVEGVSFHYNLTEDDLTRVFARYGQVRLVHVNLDGSSAVVHFGNPQEVLKAVADLDGKILNGVQGCLRVTPVQATGQHHSPTAEHDYSGSRCVRKYTARFEIGIENDRDFHVARRIIGPKGSNMKKIVMATDGAETPKLRLRGVGSGFLEGALKQESPEPLHLCVSCKDYKNYRFALEQVTSLLEGVYSDYAEYCRSRGYARPLPAVLVREHPLLVPTSGAAPKAYDAAWAMTGGLTFPQQPSLAEQAATASSTVASSPTVTKWNPNVPEWLPPPSVAQAVAAEQAFALLAEPASGDANGVRDIERLIEERNEARRVCNFKEADRIRDILRSKGIGLMDEPGGRGKGTEVTSWRYWRK